MTTKTYTFDVVEPVLLDLVWHGGDVEIDTTHGDGITIELDGPPELVEACAVRMDEGARLVIHAEKRRGVAFHAGRHGFGLLNANTLLDVHIRVPHQSSLTYTVGSADLTATGRLEEVLGEGGSGEISLPIVGNATIRSGSGGICIEHVHGDLRFSGGSGDLEVKAVDVDALLRTGSGDLTLGTVGANLNAQSGSGDVEVQLVGGQCNVQSGSGDVTLHHVFGPTGVSTASGDVETQVVDTPVPLTIRTASGDVCVEIDGDYHVHAVVETISGDLGNGLPGNGPAPDGTPYVELVINTVSGDIDLVEA